MDIGDDEGRAIAAKYGVRSVPAFLVVSSQGEVVYRKIGGTPDGDAVRAELAALSP